MPSDPISLTGHKLWNMTRPTRRLHTIIEVMPIFKKIAEGKQWNRTVQKEFESELGKRRVKAYGKVRSDSGGNRTWAVYPKVFGLWYEEDEKVVLTSAAEMIISGGEAAVNQLRHQILRFQWPNRTQEHKSQKMDEGFKIFPYRFLINLLLDERIRYLLTSEIALFVIQAKKKEDHEEVVKRILEYRKKRDADNKPLRERHELIEWHKKFRPEKSSDESYTDEEHLKYITDLANTFMNHLEFFEEIVHKKSEKYGLEKQISLNEDKVNNIRQLIARYDKEFPLSVLAKHEYAKWFVSNYGNRYDRHKASGKTTKPRTKQEKDIELVENSYEQLMQKKLDLPEKTVISILSKNTGKSEEEIKKIISSSPARFNFYHKGNDKFTKKYLEVAPDGDRNQEFESMTREIFESFGFPTEKIEAMTETGNKLKIDGFVQNVPNLLSGVIDAKSGKKFSCGNKEVGIMRDYIKHFANREIKGKAYRLDFFAYIYGKKFDNKSNFKRIMKETGIHGAIISAHELLRLKEKFDRKEITNDRIWELFKKDDEITISL